MSQPPQPPQPPNTPPDQPYGYPEQPYPDQQQYGYPQQQPYPEQQQYGYPQQPGWGTPDPYAQPYAQPQQPGYQQQPYADPYAADPYAADPYGGQQQPYADPYAADPYGGGQQAYPGQQSPYGDPQQPYGYDQQAAYQPQAPAQPGYAEQPAAYAQPQPAAQPYQDGDRGEQGDPGDPGEQGEQGGYDEYDGGDGGGTGGRKLYLMVAGIVALVVVIGGGIWLMTSGGSGSAQAGGASDGSGSGVGPHAAQGALRWTVAAPKVSKAQIVSPTPGMWFAGKDIVKQSTTGVAAYDLGTGHQVWSTPVPAGRACQASSTAAGGKVAVQYGTHCENVMGVDLSTGKALWHKPLSSGSGGQSFVYNDADLAVSANTVAVAWDDNAAAFNLTTGKSQWTSHAGDNCQEQGFGGGSRMIEVYKCGYSDSPPYHVRLIDPATGKAQWTWDAPAHTQVTNVISVDPVVIGLGAGSTLMTDIWDIDGGHLHGKISLGQTSGGAGKYDVHCPANQMTPCQDVAVSGDTLYLATHAHAGSKQGGAPTNEVAAFNLTTGGPRWLSKDGDEPLDVITTQGDTVIAYQQSGYDTPGKIIGVNAANGAFTTLTSFAAGTQAREHDAYGPGVTGLNEQYQNGVFAFSLTEVDQSGEYGTLMAVMR